MKPEEMTAKLEEALKDEAFIKALAEAESPEAAQKLFAEKGIEISIEDLKKIAEQLNNANGEIGDEELEAVSGGAVLLGPFGLCNPIVKGILKIVSKVIW